MDSQLFSTVLELEDKSESSVTPELETQIAAPYLNNVLQVMDRNNANLVANAPQLDAKIRKIVSFLREKPYYLPDFVSAFGFLNKSFSVFKQKSKLEELLKLGFLIPYFIYLL